MNKILYIFALLLVTACSGNDPWVINGNVEGLGTQNIRAYYYTPSSGVKMLSTSAIDGKFTLRGDSRVTTVVDIYNNQYRLLGQVPVHNGQNISATFALDNPFKTTMKGNKEAEMLAAFYTKFADKDTATVSQAAADWYILQQGDLPSTLSLTRFYLGDLKEIMDSVPARKAPAWLTGAFMPMTHRADSVLAGPLTIWVRGDSNLILTHDSRELIVFTGRMDSVSRHSLVNSLDSIAKLNKDSLRVVEISLLPDTADWHRMTGDSTVRFTPGWLPGGIANPAIQPFAIDTLPVWFSVDSTAHLTIIPSPCL